MKTNSALSLSGALLLCAALNASAARRRHPPRPATPAPAIVAPTPVADNHLRKFREITVNTVFCFPTDREHEWFPLIKISDTQAKNLVTPAVPTSTVRTLPQEFVVYLSQKKTPTQVAAH